MRGNRKLIVFFGAGGMLLTGLGFCIWGGQPGIAVALYASFATGLATATGIFTWGNREEHKHAAVPGPGATP